MAGEITKAVSTRQAEQTTEKGIIQYRAMDGVDVKLSPSIVMRYIVSNGEQIDNREIYSFMMMCQARKLNPLAKDCYLQAFKGRATVVVSKDYFVRTANLHETFNGMEAGVVVRTAENTLEYREGALVLDGEQLIGGWCNVHDRRREYPSKAVVSFKEYNKGKSSWLTIPATMIRKVAVVQALREAYPESYGGIYDADELPSNVIGDNVETAKEATIPEIVNTETGLLMLSRRLMTLINAVEDTCENLYMSCEGISKAVKRLSEINDALDKEASSASISGKDSKTYYQRINRLYAKLADSEEDLLEMEKSMIKLLKKQNMILEQIEREQVNIQQFKLH